MYVKPEYQIDKMATKVYNITFDDKIDCIYFNADIFDERGSAIVMNKDFSLFLDDEFSIYDIKKLLPKSIETVDSYTDVMQFR